MVIQKEAYTILETDADVTLNTTTNTASVDSEIANYRVPDRTVIKIKRGMRCYVYLLKNSTQVTAGTLTVYKTSTDKKQHRVRMLVAGLDELDAGGTPEDTLKQMTFKADFIVRPKEYILFELNSATGSIPTTGISFKIDCIKISEWTL